MKKVYLDNAATTPIREEVAVKMTQVLRQTYGNPSSSHAFGRSAKTLVEQARKTIAHFLNVSASEIIFTSGGTEADNLILTSAVQDLGVKRIITSPIEHHAVLHVVEHLQQLHDIQVDFVKLNDCGKVDLKDLENLLKSSAEKTLVSLMYINNEIGSLLEIKKVGKLCKENSALFHSDTVQSIGHFELDFKGFNVDFAAASAHKFHGPKGTGFAYIRKESGIQPLIIGGEQERGLRAGTESVHNIVGMAEAMKCCYDNLEAERKHIEKLKTYFIQKLKVEIPGVKFNGNCDNQEESTYTILNVCLPIATEKALMLLFQLDLNGIACSKGSACQSGSQAGSHVLNAVLSEEDLQKPSLRFSFSFYNTQEEIDYVVNVLKKFMEK